MLQFFRVNLSLTLWNICLILGFLSVVLCCKNVPPAVCTRHCVFADICTHFAVTGNNKKLLNLSSTVTYESCVNVVDEQKIFILYNMVSIILYYSYKNLKLKQKVFAYIFNFLYFFYVRY
jgi:hypothetical protein